jgi:electron-transferring-flavoprotein dehydrogenase
MDESGRFVRGIATVDTGIAKNWEPKSTFQRGMELHAKQVVLAEGARGSLSERAIKEFNLRRDSDEQTYGIGLKEVWEVPEEDLVPGLVEHTVGYPLTQDVYGGSFMYHEAPNRIHLGFVVGLDYKNPYLNPYMEFQRLKTHPEISKHLKNGKCIKYGARALNEGGFFSVPKLTFPGGLLVGCSAGLLNVAKIKGANAAVVSGITAAESIYYMLHYGEYKPGIEITAYETSLKKTDVWNELYKSRNFHGGFKYGLYAGLAHGFMITVMTRGREFWNLRTTGKDTTKTLPASKFTVRSVDPAYRVREA